MNVLEIVSIAAAAIAVSFGAIGPALAEGRAVAAAMDAIARQPEAAATLSRTLVRRPGDDRDHGDLLPGRRAAGAVRQPVHSLAHAHSTGGRWRSRPSMSSFSSGFSRGSSFGR